MSLDKKQILVTGGAGFIGSNLALQLQADYPNSKIVVLDKFRGNERLSNGSSPSLGHYKNLLGYTGEVVYGDITSADDMNKLKEQYKFDVIYHLAAISDTTAQEQDLIMETNLNSFYHIINMALAHKAQLVYASSAATYGSAEAPQQVGIEAPLNVYGYSKLMMDHLAKEYYEKGINIIGLRFFNVYGAREYFKGKSASTILQFGLQFLEGKQPKLFVGSNTIYRDFVYIKDVVSCCLLAGSADVSGVYNVGTGIPRTFEEIYHTVRKELSLDVQPDYIENKFTKQYQFFTQADISSTQKDLGYESKYSLEDGVADYIEEIKNVYTNEF